MAIHWIIWLIIGVAITIFSWSLGSKFVLFFYAGLVFVGIGIAKLGIRIVVGREKKAVKETQQPHPSMSQHAQHGWVQGHQHAMAQGQHIERPQYYICPRCRQPLVRNAKFCHNCGLPLQ
jgi:Zn-dependent protease with chaperone function